MPEAGWPAQGFLVPVCDTAVNAAVRTLVFANFLAPNMTSTYADVTAQVGERLGVPTALVKGVSLDQLREASVDIAFLCGLPYVRLLQEQAGVLRLLAAPVLDEPRYGGQHRTFCISGRAACLSRGAGGSATVALVRSVRKASGHSGWE